MTQTEQFDLMIRQVREVGDLRKQQLDRDGRIYNDRSQEWFFPDGTWEPAWNDEGENDVAK